MDSSGPAMARAAAAARAIADAHAEAVLLAESLSRQWNAIVEASALGGNDDEHDPEGVTVAFERAQVQGLLNQARTDIAELDLAAQRVSSGAYWVCERCGGPIADERLAARPAARTCITCATKIRR